MRTSPLFVALATFTSLAESVLEDKYLFNNADLYWSEAGLRDLPTPSRTIVKRPFGQLPKSCLEAAVNAGRCDRYNIEVFDITYSDCETPWTVCRCKTVPAEYSINILANNIGKLPVGARSWVREFHSYDTTTGGGAFSTGNDITIFGSYPTSTILFHETGHNLDAWYASGVTLPPAGWFSASQAWQSLASKDTCIPTAYTRSSWAESFAEFGTQAFYEENVGPVPIGTQCMDDFLTTARRVLRGAINKAQNPRCTYRFSPGTTMCAGPTARAQGACEGLLDLGQIPNKRDENGTISDFPNERILARSEEDIREFDAQIERRSPLSIKGREVHITKDSPPLLPPTSIEKRQSASYKLQLCEHMNYGGRCVSLPAPYGVCHTIIGENQDWASSAKAGAGGTCTLYKAHRCLTTGGTLTVTAAGTTDLYPVGFDNNVRSYKCSAA